jgi:hypothetical protein
MAAAGRKGSRGGYCHFLKARHPRPPHITAPFHAPEIPRPALAAHTRGAYHGTEAWIFEAAPAPAALLDRPRPAPVMKGGAACPA